MEPIEVVGGLPLLSRFALIMTLVLVMPRLMERLRLPDVLGFILTGFLLGPKGLGIVTEHSPIVRFFSELGVLLLMFFVGLEVDLVRFRRAGRRAAGFGALTFLLPFSAGMGVAASKGYGWNASVLIGSLLASHTLLGFPIVSRLGLGSRDPVMVTVGATVFTDVAAMLVLAVCVPIHVGGFSTQALALQLVELAIYVPAVLVGLTWAARGALARYGALPEGRMAILLILVAVAAQGAELIELEGIVGAFLAGIAVKRAIGEGHVAEDLEVVSRTLFIPAFFITTGFLLDLAAFAKTATDPLLTVGLAAGLVLGKYGAARAAGALFDYERDEVLTMWSLSLPQVAATLAAALVAFRVENAAGVRLVDEPVLDAVLLLVLLTSVGGPILTERYARRLAAEPDRSAPDTE